jgi:membrane-associated phospholipid phosphatase
MPVIAHLRALWGKWWLLPALPLLFLGFLAATGKLRPEHLIIVAVLVFAAVFNARTKELLVAVLPGIAILLGYELVEYLQPILLTPQRVLGCNLRDFEGRLFSINGTTVSDFFATHHNSFFDVFFAIPYTFFWVIVIAYTIFLYFHNREQMSHYLWVLALTHAVAFVIWILLPAAPPWYIRLNGCGIDLAAAPSPAALGRIDQLFGISYFHQFYSRAPTVFGALPSLHCTFPAAGLVAAWRHARWPERSVHLAYVLWMLVASVYLGHHWLLDGLTGIAIVAFADAVVVRFLPVRGGSRLTAPLP